MTTPILDRTRYDNRAERWRDNATGRFIPHEAVVSEMRVHQQATYATLEGLTNQLYAKQITLAQWQLGVASELKDAHLAQAMFGAGGRANMTFVEFGRVGQTLREQYSFLNKFAADIAAGRQSQAQALARIRQYGNASAQSYYAEYVERRTGNIYWRTTALESCPTCLAYAAGSPYTKSTLPAYPCDGGTQCLANCKCYLSEE